MKHACRLYLITPPQIGDLDAFAETLKAALGAGDIACLQLRLKAETSGPANDETVLRAAETLAPIVRAHDVAFLINDSPELARQSDADGVHIGQSDASYEEARAMLGVEAMVGVTCHNSKHLALVAGEAGADYIAFGAFFPTATKEVQTKASPALLEWWAYATTVPSVAIGGVTPENCAPLVRAGADFLAASSSVWDHRAGPAAAVKAFEEAIRAA